MDLSNLIALLSGVALFLFGMTLMGDGLKKVAGNKLELVLYKLSSSPMKGVLLGTGVTAIIQSSSASVGILQALANSGVVTLDSAVFVLFGQNIGTCITAVLASIGTSRNAKRTTIIHLMFNIIGTIVFTTLCLVTPMLGLSLVDFMKELTPTNPAGQIANMHPLFNIVTTLLLLPLGGYLVKAAMHILPERKQDMEEGMHLAYLTPINANQDRTIGHSAIYISQLRQELNRMLAMAQENVSTAFQAVLDRDPSLVAKEEEVEEYIDFLNKEISQFISHVIVHETNEQDSAAVSAYFKITGNIERIGDHAVNIQESAQELHDKELHFSDSAREELQVLLSALDDILDLTLRSFQAADPETAGRVEPLEETIDQLIEEIRTRHTQRLQTGQCTIQLGFVLSDLLTNIERVSDHCSNIAVGVIQEKDGGPGGHAYLQEVKAGGAFSEDLRRDQKKYHLPEA